MITTDRELCLRMLSLGLLFYSFIVFVLTLQFCYLLLTTYIFTVLQEHKFFEDAFKVYERGVQVFKHPHVRLIWSMYLDKFVNRYGGKKLERARDLFEQALKEVRSIVSRMHLSC